MQIAKILPGLSSLCGQCVPSISKHLTFRSHLAALQGPISFSVQFFIVPLIFLSVKRESGNALTSKEYQ